MSRLKDQMIEQEANFWSKAESLIGSFDNLGQFLSETMKIAPNFLINSPISNSKLIEELEEGWKEKWSKYNG